jgi:hypothetical protein
MVVCSSRLLKSRYSATSKFWPLRSMPCKWRFPVLQVSGISAHPKVCCKFIASVRVDVDVRSLGVEFHWDRTTETTADEGQYFYPRVVLESHLNE